MITLKLDELIKSLDLYKEAFTHKSLSFNKNFERLEFLGDALLGSKITELLYLHYPNHTEGDLSRWKSAIVSEKTLLEISNELGLIQYLICKSSEKATLLKNTRIKASILESFLGAYYLEKGYEEFSIYVISLFQDRIKNAKLLFLKQDPKTIFQEKAQNFLKITPTYKVLEQTGPPHCLTFIAGVIIKDKVYESGKGHSIKEAQMEAARNAIIRLENSGHG